MHLSLRNVGHFFLAVRHPVIWVSLEPQSKIACDMTDTQITYSTLAYWFKNMNFFSSHPSTQTWGRLEEPRQLVPESWGWARKASSSSGALTLFFWICPPFLPCASSRRQTKCHSHQGFGREKAISTNLVFLALLWSLPQQSEKREKNVDIRVAITLAALNFVHVNSTGWLRFSPQCQFWFNCLSHY